MTTKYHITEKGPSVCTAEKRKCPHGGEHFDSLEGAEKSFEQSQAHSTFRAVKKSDTVDIAVSPATQEVVNRLTDTGARALLVGGVVRDHYLGRVSKDIDIEVYGAEENGNSLSLANLSKSFPRRDGFRVDEAGVAFAVLKVAYKGEDFDVSLPRTEQSTGDSHTDYEVAVDSRLPFGEASSRRDFTINSMAVDASTRELVDPHGGREDLRKGVLRHVGPAFSDDPLRVLRAVNFASRFGFRLHPETAKLCQQLSPQFPTVAGERVAEEFRKCLAKGKHLDVGFETFRETGWTEHFSGFREASDEDLKNIGATLNKVPSESMRRVALAHEFRVRGMSDPTHELTLSKDDHQSVSNSLKLISALEQGSRSGAFSALRKLEKTTPVSNDEMSNLLTVLNIKNRAWVNLPNGVPQPVVTGKRLIEDGFQPGPEMGSVLSRALKIQDDTSNYDYDDLKRQAVS